ncbi:hypothetical protein CAPTEDRAFT_209957, partial [Capitella teleta]
MKAHLMPPLDEMEAILLDKFKDLESFDRFDSGVAGNPQNQKALTHHFMSFIIANDVGTTARGMLRSIINNNVMNEFTMDGRQHRKPGGVVSIKKRPFKDTKCYAVMKKAINRRSDIKFSLAEFQTAVGRALTMAKHRGLEAENTENCEEFDDEDHAILEEDLDL